MKYMETGEDGADVLDGLDSGDGDDDVLNPVSSDDAPGLGLDSGEGDGDSGQELDSPEVRNRDGIPKIPGLTIGADGEFYYNGDRVKSITPLGSDVNNKAFHNNVDNDDEDDDDVDDGDVDSGDVDDGDVDGGDAVNDNDGVIEPDVGWQDEDITEVT